MNQWTVWYKIWIFVLFAVVRPAAQLGSDTHFYHSDMDTVMVNRPTDRSFIQNSLFQWFPFDFQCESSSSLSSVWDLGINSQSRIAIGSSRSWIEYWEISCNFFSPIASTQKAFHTQPLYTDCFGSSIHYSLERK